MPPLPSGTVTLLFTDIEGSTRLVQTLGADYPNLLSQVRAILRAALGGRGGVEVDTEGDGMFVAFPRATDAVLAVVETQRTLLSSSWPAGAAPGVRMGLHTGEPVMTAAGYAGVDVHRAGRICAAGHGEQILLSETTRDLVGESLPGEIRLRGLGQHRLRDLSRPVGLFQVVAPGLPDDFPPLRTLSVLPNNLPIQLTSFVGRQREISEVRGILGSSRLLTLTGPGGSGKTRLALQVAADALDEFSHGVWMADLAPLSDPALVPQAVAAALGIRELPQRDLADVLVETLRAQAILLLLDNCEHVLGACARLSRALLEACAEVRILATSREPLGLPGETAWLVPPLALPDGGPPLTVSTAWEQEAVRLFVERATAVHRAFRLTEASLPAVVDICRHLDGIPLAIELAAARVKVLGVEQIVRRLEDRFRLLRAPAHAAPPRHQTLAAALEWSLDLLTEPERILFRRLPVFAGGFPLQAAEQICSGDGLAPEEILDLLERLADKSLLLVEGVGGAEVRYRLLETVRQFALEKTRTAGEEAAVRERHRDWYVALAEHGEPALRSPEQQVWLPRLDAELDNFRAVLEWCRTHEGGPEHGLQLAGALGHYWDMRGHLREGRRWLDEMLVAAPAAPDGVRARALNWAGVLAYRQGAYDRVRVLCQDALALSQATGNRWGMALALHHLGHHAQTTGAFSEAERQLQESIDLFHEVADRWGIGLSLNCLADVARQQGQDDRAVALFEEALRFEREVADTWLIGATSSNLAYVMLHRRNYARAAQLFRESLESLRAMGTRHWLAYVFAGLAGAAAGGGQLRRAATLFGIADGLLEVSGARLEPADQADFERHVARVRAGLDAATFTAAWEAGKAMGLDDAVAFALAAEPAQTGRAAARPVAYPLTAREREVATMVARGLTNREIAALLFITERTAETHVQHILNRLGFNSRAQIAAWATEQGLVSPSTE